MSVYSPVVFSKRGVAHRADCIHAAYRDVQRFEPDGWEGGHPFTYYEPGINKLVLAWVRPCGHCQPERPGAA